MLKEFRDFIAKGNVMDLAVGIIIGAAFTAIVQSLVKDLINPVIGLIIGGIDFSGLYIVMKGQVAPGASLAAARDTAGGRDLRLWLFHQRGEQFPHDRMGGLHAGEDGEPG